MFAKRQIKPLLCFEAILSGVIFSTIKLHITDFLYAVVDIFHTALRDSLKMNYQCSICVVKLYVILCTWQQLPYSLV